jgi:hypothetical protein
MDLPVPTFPPSRAISRRQPSKSACSMHIRLRIFFLTSSGTAACLMFLWTCTWHSQKNPVQMLVLTQTSEFSVRLM